MKILMVASENDALPGGKVGGIADVLRDIPVALAGAGQTIDVVLPGYGHFSKLPGAQFIDLLPVTFAGHIQSIELYRIEGHDRSAEVTQWVLEHPLFSLGGAGRIYCDDSSDRPFATDATKFALFCAGVAKALCLGVFGEIDILHLHDWHSAMLAVLRAYDPQYGALQDIPTVFTIHNLALQGIRPFCGDDSSLKTWFPMLKVDQNQVMDPRYPNCINLMRCGINLCDKVHAVSDSYAHEILLPSNAAQGYFGGEGLEMDLQKAADTDRLHGILNGCDYSPRASFKVAFDQLLIAIEDDLLLWTAKERYARSAHIVALNRIARLKGKKPKLLVTSVGRLTGQKVTLLQQTFDGAESALERMLDILGPDSLYVLIGSGDPQLEAFMTSVAAKRNNFLFLNGYSQFLPDILYDCGDLFVMPSSFEPCGISQMLAMRSGQPCLVHGVGGLADTVKQGENGFVFKGQSLPEQARHMVDCFDKALQLRHNNRKAWNKIVEKARQSRFLWADSARQYIERLYEL